MARIFLSPSSQEANKGVVRNYIEEIECNKIARACGALLEKSGHTIGYNDPGETYRQHVDRAKTFGADVIICIHTNASSDASVSGLHAGCYDPTDASRKSTQLTQAIFDALAPVTPSLKDKMVQYRFYEVTENVPPVAYIETSFHTNITDCNWLMDNTALIGRKIAEGISTYLKTPLTVEVEQPAPDWAGQLKDKDQQIADRDARIAALEGQNQTLRDMLTGAEAATASIRADYDALVAKVRAKLAADKVLEAV